jgi:phenylpropionate dioxygenase-like ring-hydroxylating dioxygenase large terminal subunit
MQQLARALSPGATVDKETIQHVAADVYLDTHRFSAEQSRLFRRMPVPVAPAALLPDPGQYVTHDAYGVPLIVTRDRDGRARIFFNVCRHRGTRLVADSSPVNAGSIVCPYHAWTYNLDGTLRGFPRPDCFPGLDKQTFGLKRLCASEAGGIIWTQLDGGEPDVPDFLGSLVDDFDAIGIGDSYVYRRNTHDVGANWKLIMDAFLESYHVQRLHKESIAPFFADAVTASSRSGIHFRNAVARYDHATAAPSDKFEELRQTVTFSYSVLPGMVIVVSPDYINIMQLYPQSVDRTLVEDFMLIAEPPADADAERHWARSFELLDSGVFAGEDFRAATLGQQGLATGELDRITLGTAETGIADMHTELDRLLSAQDN